MEQIYSLYVTFEHHVFALLITIPRIYAFLIMTQLVSKSATPRIARNAIVLVLATPLVPVHFLYVDQIDKTLSSYALFLGKEVILGFLFGYITGSIFWVVTAVGDFIDNQRGAAIASSIDPLLGQETSSIGILLSQAFMTYLLISGGFLALIGIFYSTYILWPVTQSLPIFFEDFPSFFLSILDYGMELMFVVAFPVVAVMFIAEFCLALISRFAPQIQVFILAMPIKSAVGLFVLYLYMVYMFDFLVRETLGFELKIQHFIELLSQNSL